MKVIGAGILMHFAFFSLRSLYDDCMITNPFQVLLNEVKNISIALFDNF